MVKIRLKRGGKRFVAYYKIVVADARTPRDGKFIEEVGNYDPFTKECRLKSERVSYWLSVGAQPTNVVKRLLKTKSLLDESKEQSSKLAQEALSD